MAGRIDAPAVALGAVVRLHGLIARQKLSTYLLPEASGEVTAPRLGPFGPSMRAGSAVEGKPSLRAAPVAGALPPLFRRSGACVGWRDAICV